MSASWQQAVALDVAVKKGTEIKLGISLTVAVSFVAFNIRK